ncbi:MBL fold metallo-hydrolase [Ferrimonas marina]|uniref:Glyoxylase, beta-lactamase superfamily II n=1 Tax=Ferrimonas marina TaxID=299255 RepID=A0A1M5P7J6_9GAMM|nr:MBL fold metallo-hydrolase [Ferrimonas marina]SHG97675.1 Glyoxylase, beta-lactamase superfamily II [Ferrimonas marina]
MQLHRFGGYIQTIYLAEYDHGLLLLDGCSRADVGTVLRFIRDKLRRPITDLKLVVVTHMHPDHAGAAGRLKALTGCQIASGEAERHWYSGLDGRLMHLTDVALAQYVATRLKRRRRNIWYPAKLHPDVVLSDGQPLPGFEEWQTVTTHGHTDRDISLHHLPSRRIYVADLMVKVKGRYVPPFPIFHPNRYRESLAKVRELEPHSVILAHGGEVRLTDKEYDHLATLAPRKPKTHWRAVKARFQRALLPGAGH